MKKNLLLLFAALLPLVASAEKVEINGIWYNITSETDKTAEVTYKGDSYNSYDDEYSGSITIPATVTHNGVQYSVTSIGDYAFLDCSSLTSITLPATVTHNGVQYSVTSIGDYAFNGCSSLTAITLPEGVTIIGLWAFDDCSSLTAINIPEGVTGIGVGAFSGCSSLERVTINCANVGQWFRELSSIKEIVLGASVTSIGSYAFEGCSSLTSINIPESVTSIGSEAFEGCSSLTTINIPESVTSIGKSAFSSCSSLTAVYISSIEAWCKISFDSYYSNPLYYAHNLYLNGKLVTELVIPEGVTSIGNYAFFNCSSLTAITIPEGVTSIGKEAFSDCSSLTAITLPEGVTSIGKYAFANCYKLRDVYCYAEIVPRTETDAFDGSSTEYAMLHVPESAVVRYKSSTPWSKFGMIERLTDTEEGIDNSEIRNENSTLIYDLNGRRVAHPMKSGIYIIGSKKVVIR